MRMIGLSESTYYDRKKRVAYPLVNTSNTKKGRPYPGYSLTKTGQKVSDEQIKEWLLELAEGEEHVYGYKLLAQCLRNEHELILDKKKSYRLCKELGILHKQREKKNKHPRRLAKNRLVTEPNQLWQIDIKYGYVAGRDRFFFVLSIIDVFDRVIVDYYRGPVCEAKHACQTLWRALEKRIKAGGALPVIRSDNGPQFVSTLFGDTCESLEIVHERIPPRSPNMNAYIESFHSLLERDLFSKMDFMTFDEAYEAVDRYMDFYNNRRMHGSLKRMPPNPFSEWVMQLEDRTIFHKAL
ncbi:IS3 family transposase [Paenibacillus radicis (ex Xue et al. 2023)]|uniref:IS3 family transposase n=2 Tax=Paenibacillus radicis (ex Xue et al. 2023) TaxID=2972489 RepID=A0ABT1YVI9_9BACL|nr:IS3 family transposase [Paenibacillus radicis (ex Xue et al. 2023)]MCR8636972.1 IS3 family transposase [Paenibacillus radicis (ex Xue et al. 2023)]